MTKVKPVLSLVLRASNLSFSKLTHKGTCTPKRTNLLDVSYISGKIWKLNLHCVKQVLHFCWSMFSKFKPQKLALPYEKTDSLYKLFFSHSFCLKLCNIFSYISDISFKGSRYKYCTKHVSHKIPAYWISSRLRQTTLNYICYLTLVFPDFFVAISLSVTYIIYSKDSSVKFMKFDISTYLSSPDRKIELL